MHDELKAFMDKVEQNPHLMMKRDEAIQLLGQLTKHLEVYVESSQYHADGDILSVKLTTRFSLSRSELEDLV
jgi:hypothetical protein